MSKVLKATLLWIVFIIGIALIVLPFPFHLFDRADAGATMMKDFSDHKVLEQPTVDQFKADLATIEAMQADLNGNMMPWLAGTLQKTPDELNALLGENFADLAAGLGQMDDIKARLKGVIEIMDRNVTNFAKANELPMKWMPWFFIIPGAVIVLLLLIRVAIRTKKEVVVVEPVAPAKPAAPTAPPAA